MPVRWILLGILIVHGTAPAVSQITSWRKKLASTAVAIGINPITPSTVFAEGAAGDLMVSYDGGSTWTKQGAPGITRFRQILVHPSDTLTLFCVSSLFQPLRKSTDYGATWHTVLPNISLTDETMAFDPGHPDTLFIGNSANSHVYRSTDRGESWTSMGSTPRSLVSLVLRPDSTSILYAGTGGPAIYKSTDSGATWREAYHAVTGSGEISAMAVSRSSPLVAYAAIEGTPDTSYGLLKTTDGGEHWQTTPLTNVSLAGMAICEPNPNIVYAGSSDSRMTAVYMTTDGGSTWTAITAGLTPGGYVWSLEINPLESGKVWAAMTKGTSNPDGVYRLGTRLGEVHGSVLDAATADTVKNGFIFLAETYDSIGLGSTGGTFDFGVYDVDVFPPSLHTAAYPYYLKDTILAADSTVSQDVLLQELALSTIEGTITDSSHHKPVNAAVTVKVHVSFGEFDLISQTDSAGYFKFTHIALPYPPLISDYALLVDPEIPYLPIEISPVTVSPSGTQFSFFGQTADVFVAGEDSGNYATYFKAALDSLGVSSLEWNSITNGPAPLQRGIEFNRKTVIYFSGSKHTPLDPKELAGLGECLNAGCNLFLTGQDIVEKNDSSDLLLNQIGVTFDGNTPYILCTGQSGDLFNGASYFTTGSGANNQTSRDIISIVKAGVKPILTYGSPLVAGIRLDSAAGGGKCILTGFGFESISGALNRKTVMQRVLGYFDGSIIVGVDDSRNESFPLSFRLEQNYPNPFNPSTLIRFSISDPEFVRLSVFNILGEGVANLTSEFLHPGYYTRVFTPDRLPSGVYFYRLRAGRHESTKKLILLR